MRVFISHSTEDRQFVERQIVRRLHHGGIETWYSRDSIEGATRWEREILNGLRSCEQFLVVMSPRSARSPWVKREVDWAFAKNRPVIPVIIEDCDPEEFHFGMAGIQFFDFRHDAEAAAQRLLRALGGTPSRGPLRDPASPLFKSTPAVRRNSLGMTLLEVPAALCPPSTLSVHVAATCVTNRAYAAFVADGGRAPRPNPKNKDHVTWTGEHYPPVMAEHPVILVKQEDAMAFCRWLTEKERRESALSDNEEYTLPSIEQWQAVARNSPIPATAILERAWLPGRWQPTEPVTFGEPSPLGLFNLFGNVFEWCHDTDKRKFRVSSADGKSEVKLLSCALAIGGGWASTAHWLRQEVDKQTFGAIGCPGGWPMQDGGFRVWLVRK